MANIFERLTGIVEVEITGPRPERILNVLAARNIKFWNAEKISDDSVRLKCSKAGEVEVKQTADDCGLTCRALKRAGLLFFARRFKKRWALLASAALVIIAAYYLSLFIWEVRVEGNETVSSGEIIAALEGSGYGVGCFGPLAEREYASSYIRMTVGKLSWVGINIDGCVLTVMVRERREPPEIVSRSEPCDIVAAKTGVIVSFDDFEGRGLLKPGDTVLKGQTMVSGQLDSLVGGVRYVRSIASVKAKTWYELSSVMPLEYITKSYTGLKSKKTAFTVADIRINLFLNSGIMSGYCDNIRYNERGTLFGAFPLPVERLISELTYYEPEPARMAEWEAEAILKQGLERRLKDMLGGGEVVDITFESTSDGESVTVVLRAQCIEEIARVAPLKLREEASGQ